MVIDSSALVAILLSESTATALSSAIEDDPRRLVSATTVLESGMVIEGRLGLSGGRELDLLLHRIDATTTAVDARQAEAARVAWRRYGKGHHPAALNFGDCFSYALAVTTGEPLLCVGDDFSQTGLTLVPLG